MRAGKIAALIVTHLGFGAAGFALGIYTLPILIAPPAPSSADVTQLAEQALYSGNFTKDRQDSDALHWGEGQVAITPEWVTFMGSLAPGPDYKLYLSPEFVETEADFNRLKSQMALVGSVNTFENFVVNMPKDVDISRYNTVIVWCESFGEFISSAQYQ